MNMTTTPCAVRRRDSGKRNDGVGLTNSWFKECRDQQRKNYSVWTYPPRRQGKGTPVEGRRGCSCPMAVRAPYAPRLSLLARATHLRLYNPLRRDGRSMAEKDHGLSP